MVMLQAYNISMGHGGELEKSGMQSQAWQYSKLEVYTRACLKNRKKKSGHKQVLIYFYNKGIKCFLKSVMH